MQESPLLKESQKEKLGDYDHDDIVITKGRKGFNKRISGYATEREAVADSARFRYYQAVESSCREYRSQ